MTLTDKETATAMSCALLKGENPVILNALPDGSRKHYRRGEAVYTPSDYRRELGIILSGSIIVTKADSMVVSNLNAGDIFGAAALYTDGEEYATTLTVKSDCVILFITQAQLQQMMAENCVVRDNYIAYLTARIRFLSNKIDMLIPKTGTDKLMAVLTSMMDGDGAVRGCSMTRLAKMINMPRSTFYRSLDELEREGRISKNGTEITVLK